MSQPHLCPLHGFERKRCSVRCEVARRELKKLGALYRQYWWARRQGIKPMSQSGYVSVQLRARPAWQGRAS